MKPDRQTPSANVFSRVEIGVLAAAILVACATAGTLAVWLGLHDDYQTLEHRTQAVQRELDVRVASTNALLTSITGMYRASDEFRPYELLDLSRELLSAYPYIRLISVSDAVSAADRETWERQMHEEGFPTIRIKPRNRAIAPNADPIPTFPIKFLEPMEPEFARFLGFDIASQPGIGATLTGAVDSGAIGTSELVSLVDGVEGWLFMKAVYSGHEVPTSLKERQQQLVGVISLHIGMDDLVADIGHAARGLPIRVSENRAQETGYHSALGINWGWPPVPELTSSQPMTINGQSVTLTMALHSSWTNRKLALPATFVMFALSLGLAATVAYRSHRMRVKQAAEMARVDRENEQRFRDYAEVASDWFWSMDAELRFDFISDRLKAVTGLDPSQFLGRGRLALANAAMDERVAQNIEDMKARRSFRDFRYRSDHDPERPHWFSISGKPVFSGTGEFLGYRGTACEVTQDVEARDEINRAKESAERANHVKSEFLATMSHELRTPLNAILGFSEVMKDEVFGPVGSAQYREYAENINDSGQHLLDLINDVLDISKIGAGKDELDESEFPIPSIVESVRNLVLPRAEKGEVALAVTFGAELPLLRADERKVKQVLLNLIVNAIKFTDPGGKVSIDIWSSLNGEVVFQIADNGIGIAPEEVKTAFSKFGQIDSSLARKCEGTGLGLPLAKALVELHDGTLKLKSKVGVGTTVTVRFPFARSASSNLAPELQNRLAI